jgi:RimJ/RimL family protein N-acetyltransferase
MRPPILITQRLRLEPFSDAHLDQIYLLNSDPDVMRYITGKPQTLDETRTMIERVRRHWADYGKSWWCFIDMSSNELVGAGCIQHLAHDPANPLEIGWRLRKNKWHQGYATEAAQCMAAHAFDTLGSPDLTAVCHPDNNASEQVMKRLGMRYRGIERWYDLDLVTYYMTRKQYEASLLVRAIKKPPG